MVQQLGYDYATIGVAFMLYNGIASFAMFSTLKRSLGLGRVIIQSSIALLATFLLANSTSYFPVLFLALSLAYGLGIGFFESVVAKAVKNTPTVSVDIGLLHIPTRLAEFASVLATGFVAQFLGYAPVFALSGVFFVTFSVLSLYALRA